MEIFQDDKLFYWHAYPVTLTSNPRYLHENPKYGCFISYRMKWLLKKAELANIYESFFRNWRKIVISPGEISDVNAVCVCWTWKYPNHGINKSESNHLSQKFLEILNHSQNIFTELVGKIFGKLYRFSFRSTFPATKLKLFVVN